MNCPQCKQGLVPIGNAKSGQWEAGSTYRCSKCPTGSNRFTADRNGCPVYLETQPVVVVSRKELVY